MAQVAACPDDPQFERMVRGQATPAEGEAFAAHLEQCPACAERLDRALAGDTVLAAMRSQATAADPPADPAVPLLVERLLRLRAGAPSSAVPGTTTGERGGGAAARPAGCDFLAPPQAPDEIGRLGTYRALRLLGAGGMGLVFQAEDVHLKRKVALKVMKPEVAARPGARERFLREAQAAAAIEHEHIVAIHHVGEAQGVPFLAMQWLRGVSLEEYLEAGGPRKPGEVVRIGRQIALGLAAAHERGLIHRDIKPANLWLELQPGEAQGAATRARVKVLDFGLARALADEVHLTQSGAIVGTPAYMAPEQARGDKVDTRCDLFSLGVVLYRMATGRMPFRGDSTMAVLTALATETPAAPRALNARLPQELSELIMHLLAKDPAQRPATARAVADRLQRLDQQLARPGGEARRSKARSAAPARTPAQEPAARKPRRWLLALPAALLLAAAATVFFLKTPGGTVRVEINDDSIDAVLTKNGAIIKGVDRAGDITVAAGEQTLKIKRGDLEFETDKFVLRKGGTVTLKVELLPGKVQVVRDGEVIGEKELPAAPVATVAPKGTPGPASPRKLPAGAVPLDALRRRDIPPDELAAAGGGDPRQAPAELVAILGDSRLKHWASVQHVLFSPDNRLLASSGADWAVRLWDTESWKEVRALLGHQATVQGLSFSADGKLLASASEDGTVRIWGTAAGKEIRILSGHQAGVTCVAFRPDGKLLASGSWDQTVKLWDPVTGTLLRTLRGQTGGLRVLAFRGAGPVLVSGSVSGEVRFWDSETGADLGLIKAHEREVSLALRADGELLATVSWDGKIKFWEMPPDAGNTPVKKLQPRLLDTLPARGDVHSVAFSPDGRMLATAGNWILQTWDAVARQHLADWAAHTAPVHDVAFRPDGRLLASGSGFRTIQVWDPQTGRDLGPAETGSPGVQTVAVSWDGRFLASGYGDGTVTLWDSATGKALWSRKGHSQGVNSVAFDPDGSSLATVSWDGTMKLWDVAAGKETHALTGHHGAVHVVAFHPENRRLVSGGADQALKVWDLAAGYPPPVQTLSGYTSWIVAAAIHPDGRRVAAGGGDGTVRLWDTASGATLHTLTGHKGPVHSVAFRPDGVVLASASNDQTVKLWDVASGKELRSPIGHQGAVFCVAYRPDGQVLASSGADGTVRLWDEKTGRETVLRFGPPGAEIQQLTFSPDGRHLITANGNGTVYILRLAPPPADPGP